MSASMAEVLMQSMGCDVREDSPDCDHDGLCGGHGKFTYCTEHDSDEWLDPEAGNVCKFAAHQAEILAANGYGKLPEPVTEWGAAFRVTGARYNSYRTKDEAEEFVKSMNEVDADMVVITRQHTPATNTEWVEA